MMKIFSPHFDDIQNAILENGHDSKIGLQCLCGSGTAKFRCQECVSSLPSCVKCLVATHQHLPLHLVQEWTGTYFRQRTLESLGLMIFLGHHGQRCLNASNRFHEGPTGWATIIVNTNGIQLSRVEYCHCIPTATKALQLIGAGLFPVTMDQPDTAFTFTILNDFHVHTLASKKSA